MGVKTRQNLRFTTTAPPQGRIYFHPKIYSIPFPECDTQKSRIHITSGSDIHVTYIIRQNA